MPITDAVDYYTILDAAPARVVRTALELDLFAALARGSRQPVELARALAVSPGGLERLLRALAAMQMLTASDDGIALSPGGRALLIGESAQLIRDLADDQHPLGFVWDGLTDAVRRGHGGVAQAGEFFAAMNHSLERLHERPATVLAALLGAGEERRGARLLDLGCGSAVWSRAFALADPTCHVTAQDLPEVLENTTRTTSALGIGAQYSYLPGSVFDQDLGAGEYDVVIIAHLLHLLDDEECALVLRRSARALRPGGVVAIVEFLTDDLSHRARFGAMFALLMLVLSSGGNTWSAADIGRWTPAAGLSVRQRVPNAESPASFILCERVAPNAGAGDGQKEIELLAEE